MDTSNMDTTKMDSTNMDSTKMETRKRPTVITIAAILLIVLTLFVAGLGIANQYGLLGGGFGNRQFVAGQFRNRGSSSANGSQSNGSPSNGSPSSGFPSNGFTNGQNSQGTNPNFTFNRSSATGIASLTRTLRPVTLALDIILLVLSVVAAIGLFMSKRWAAILAIVVSVLVILLTIPSMIRIFSATTLIENLLRILMAVAVIVLLLLPSARRSPATSEASDQMEVERVVR